MLTKIYNFFKRCFIQKEKSQESLLEQYELVIVMPKSAIREGGRREKSTKRVSFCEKFLNESTVSNHSSHGLS